MVLSASLRLAAARPAHAPESAGAPRPLRHPRSASREPVRLRPAPTASVGVATILFADVRGFTALAEDRDPVDVLGLVNRCLEVMIRSVRGEHGFVSKFLGDGLMAAFGVRVPGDDHADRAIRAALAMRNTMARVATELHGEGWDSIGLGIGMETGRVVAGQVGTPDQREFTVLGDVVNVASRLTAGASPGEIVLGPGTSAEVADRYDLEALGLISIRGRRQPVEAWRLT